MLVQNVGSNIKEDAFSKYHPAVNLLFFVVVICFGVFFQHPAYLLAGIMASSVYYLILNGKKGWKMIGAMLPLFIFITFFNPIVNTRGETILFLLFGRPYTLEALLYGVVVASVFVVMLLWFGCYNNVLTSDKLNSLFGNIIPSISLLVIMILRMIPNLITKAKLIIGVRSCIGKGTQATATKREKIESGMIVLSILTSWALESSVVTSDSMRARGYGTAKRTSFMIYKINKTDKSLMFLMILLAVIVALFALKGSMYAEFIPRWQMADISGINAIGFIAYLAFLFIPTALHIKEIVQWNISKYKI